MEFQVLLEAGLTPGEARAYVALLNIGESTVGPIAKEASVSLSKIYEILDGLIEKGLVSSIMRNNVRYFRAAEPERIIDYLEKRKQDISTSQQNIQRILPALKAKQTVLKKGAIATLFEGFRGIKTFYENVLRSLHKGETIRVFGIPNYAAELYEGYFLDWNQRRVEKGIAIEVIYDYDARAAGKKRAKLKHTVVRYLPKQFVTPAWILVFRDTVATIHLSEKPICVIIQDKSVATTYIKFFEFLWEISKP